MALEQVRLGTPPSGSDGDDPRTAFTRINNNAKLLDDSGVTGAVAVAREVANYNDAIQPGRWIGTATATNRPTGFGRANIAVSLLHDGTITQEAVDVTSGRSSSRSYNPATSAWTTWPKAVFAGDYGLGTAGASPEATNLNAIGTSGLFRLSPGASGAPVGISYGTILHQSYEITSNNWTQLVQSMTSPRLVARSSINGSISQAELYTTANVVGAVAQAGGLVAGAVIERGSNSNGSYVKFADGTMICWASPLMPSVPANATGNMLVVFPNTFVGEMSINASVEPFLNWDHYGYIGSSGVSGLSCNVFVRNGGTAAQQFVVRYVIIGRWY